MGCFQVLSRADRDSFATCYSKAFCAIDLIFACAVCKNPSSIITNCTHPTKHAGSDADAGRAKRPWRQSVGLLLMCQISQVKRLCLSSVILIY